MARLCHRTHTNVPIPPRAKSPHRQASSPLSRVHDSLLHPHNRQCLPFSQRNPQPFHLHISSCPIKRNPRQSRTHLEPTKPRPSRCQFASIQNHAPNPPSHPFRMHKKSPDLGRIHPRIQQRILPPRPAIAPVKRLPPAPTSATHDDHFSLGLRLHHKISPIRDELAVHPIHGRERFLNLRGRVILRLQSPHRRIDQPPQHRDVLRHCQSNRKFHTGTKCRTERPFVNIRNSLSTGLPSLRGPRS